MRTLSILLLLTASKSPAQKIETSHKVLYNITISVDHISYPGNRKYEPKHTNYPRRTLHTGWGIAAGVDIPYSKKNSGHFPWGQSFRVGFLNNPGIQKAIRLYTEPTLLYKTSSENSQFLQAGLQLGYMRVYPKGGMISKKQDKLFINRKGRGQFIGGILLGYGYQFQNNFWQLQNTLQYHFWLQGPFMPKHAPLLPHQSFSLSTSFDL